MAVKPGASDSGRTVTTGGKERIPATVSLYVPVFATDPVITYMLSSAFPDPTDRLAYSPTYFRVLLKAAALNGATLDQVRDPSLPSPTADGESRHAGSVGGESYQSAGILMPPGKKVDNIWTLVPAGLLGGLWNLGFGGIKRSLDYTPRADAAKAKALGKGEKFYYVFFVGTRKDCEGKGLASTLMRHYQSIARKAGLPIWLEATTMRSRNVYLKLGFAHVAEIVLGKGHAGPDGLACKDGEGIRIYGMLWRPSKGDIGDEES